MKADNLIKLTVDPKIVVKEWRIVAGSDTGKTVIARGYGPVPQMYLDQSLSLEWDEA